MGKELYYISSISTNLRKWNLIYIRVYNINKSTNVEVYHIIHRKLYTKVLKLKRESR